MVGNSSPPFQFYAEAQTKFEIPLLANDNAFLGDILSSGDSSDVPISGGLFRLKKGQPLTYTYKFDEIKIFLEGDFIITDATGQTTKAKPGDAVLFPKGSTITFATEGGGLAFYVGQKKNNEF